MQYVKAVIIYPHYPRYPARSSDRHINPYIQAVHSNGRQMPLCICICCDYLNHIIGKRDMTDTPCVGVANIVVITIICDFGSIIGPPAESEYPVEPVGVQIITPSALKKTEPVIYIHFIVNDAQSSASVYDYII